MLAGQEAFGEALWQKLAEYAEPIFRRKLAENGADHPNQLPRELADQLFRENALEHRG